MTGRSQARVYDKSHIEIIWRVRQYLELESERGSLTDVNRVVERKREIQSKQGGKEDKRSVKSITADVFNSYVGQL